MSERWMGIKELPSHEMPRERLRDKGAQALSDTELLAILLRVGVKGQDVLELSQRLLRDYGGWAGLQRADHSELAGRHGLGPAKASTLVATLEIGRRLVLLNHGERFQIKSPVDVVQLMQLEMAHLDQEHLRVIALDTKNRVQKILTVYIGSLNSAAIRVGEVFKEALRLNACAIIIVHNHPSGDPTPSPEDVLVTRQICDAGAMLDVEVLDHLVIGKGRYVSLKERGLGFPAKR
ncbi:MAG: DNA repair protein RadC [Roseiflexaceae bacterium]|nr:DNA repair protein RadC [Roseiflexaceae bacterium]